MNNQLTELVFILDRSGSMHGLEKDTLGGFNSMMEKQKKGEVNALVTTVLFDTEIDVLHDRLSLKSVRPMTEEDYVAGGCTALLDAVGSTIHRIGTVHKYAPQRTCRPIPSRPSLLMERKIQAASMTTKT